MQFYEEYLKNKGEKKYRIDQVHQAVYRDCVDSFDEITTLSKNLRDDLCNDLEFEVLKVLQERTSKDGTVKVLFETHDGYKIESVLMRHNKGRNTVCVSCQVGCAAGCVFCATGKLGLTRNLTADEIVSQVLYFVKRFRKRAENLELRTEKENNDKYVIKDKRKLKQAELENEDKVTNIVYMGMGEPFYNYDHVMQSIRTLNDAKKLGFGSRHLTISTCGITSMIEKFMTEELQVNLAISLHAPNDALRTRLMPVNKIFPLDGLMDALFRYVKKSKRKLFFEYVMLKGLNDKDEHAKQLGKLLQGSLSHINLIPFNSGGNDKLQGSEESKMRHFQNILMDYGVPSTIRVSLGQDIDGACGQLAGKK